MSMSSFDASLRGASAGVHTVCRGCKERVCVSEPVATVGWHTVHACTPEHAISVHVRVAGAEPWAWRYVDDAARAALAPVTGRKRGPGAGAS
jgi:hypothetical protein